MAGFQQNFLEATMRQTGRIGRRFDQQQRYRRDDDHSAADRRLPRPGAAFFGRDPQHLMAALAQALPVDNPIALAGFTA
ncbi:MAG TPA: hypothetical protein VF920_14390 [Dongiaceae bacterium]